METNATRMCAVIVGLSAISVLGVDEERGEAVVIYVETTASVVGGRGHGTQAWLKD